MATGWAYVNCTDQGGQAAGPTGSLQFLTGTNATSGSKNLTYSTGSGGFPFSTLTLTGTLRVNGAISASSFHVRRTDTVSGSTLFGNSLDDYHMRSGSLYVGFQPGGIPTFQVKPALSASQTQGLRVQYTNVNAAAHTAAADTYILGVSRTGVVNIRMPTASAVGAGRLVVIKDQVSSRGGSSIYISASKAGGETIDGASYYELTGTMPAISLYSDGADWFVF
tara:strand:- start:696 stop:1364 length:669 start_codon:yes stop_codon:yes gene_type:complete